MAGRSPRFRRASALLTVLVLVSSAACSNDGPAGGSEGAGATTTAAGSTAAGDHADARTVAGAAPPTTRDRRLKSTVITRFGELITSLVAAPDGSELLVAERSGRLYRIERVRTKGVETWRPDRTPVLDLSDRVATQFDRGFLNMALVDDGRSLVVDFVGTEGDLHLEQYPYRAGRPIDASARRELVTLRWRYPFHHGSGMALDRAGNLLLGLGDKGLSLPGLPGSQDPDLVLGVVVRVPAAILADATAVWSPTPDDVVARGFRNPWRLSVDPETQDVWIGDVGNLLSEEVDRLPAADVGRTVRNYGYPYVEGSVVKVDPIPGGVALTAPVVERTHEDGACGMVAGGVYRGEAIGGLRGWFLHTDLCQQEVRAFPVDADGRSGRDRVVGRLFEPVVSLATGPRGEVFGLGSSGTLLRLDPESWTAPDSDASVPSATTSTVPVEKVQCGIAQAVEPFDYLGALRPDELREKFRIARAQLEERVPLVPADARAAAREVQRMVEVLDERLAAVGWDSGDPSLAGLRQEMIDASGPFEAFPGAISDLFGSSCA